MTGWWYKRFQISLNSPDGNSGRTLVFVLRPRKNPYGGIKLWSWHKGDYRKLERFFNNRGVYASW